MKKILLISFALLLVLLTACNHYGGSGGIDSIGVWTVYNLNIDVLEVEDRSGEFPEGQLHSFLNGRILLAEEEEALVKIAAQSHDFKEFISLLEEADYEIIADKNVEIAVECFDTSDGYECTYDVPPYSLGIAQLQVSKADDKVKEQCEADGGKYKCYGFCADEYERICDFPHEDAGQACTDNSECTGYCLVNDRECKTDCTGTCATYRLNMCDNPTHLTDGVAFYESLNCD